MQMTEPNEKNDKPINPLAGKLGGGLGGGIGGGIGGGVGGGLGGGLGGALKPGGAGNNNPAV